MNTGIAAYALGLVLILAGYLVAGLLVTVPLLVITVLVESQR